MKFYNYYILLILPLFLGFSNPTKNNNASLFKIERSKDANQIFYDVHFIEKNKLDLKNPISIYWIRNTEGGKIKPLTWIQQNYAYGLEFTKTSEKMAQFHFVSYDKRSFTLKQVGKECFKVFTQLNDKEVIVNRIFIQIDGGTFWFPKISKVELHTQDPTTKKEIVEIINP
ncbi:MAG: DUF4833 domain-containing protein [Vicingaceae bacterium]|nr:DUF4833 domain-containing protein [Vicingaceae bacterium]